MTQRWLASLAILAMAGAPMAAAQKPTFSIAAEEVRVDVLVTDKGKPMPGLKKTDFEILDNGVPQEIHYAVLQKEMPISATLVFDMSRSVAGELLNRLKGAAREFLSDLKKDDYAALVTFNNAVALGSAPTHDHSSIGLALDRVQPSGNSSLIDGTYAGLILSESRPDPSLAIVFSDGRDTFSWLTSGAVLETAKLNDAVVYAVSPDRVPKNTFLVDLTSFTGGSLFELESANHIAATFLRILDEFRQRYLVTYTPQGVSETGWHNLVVRVKHRSAKVNARPGYMRGSPGE